MRSAGRAVSVLAVGAGALGLVLPATAPGAGAAQASCTGNPSSAELYTLGPGAGQYGYYVLPSSAPKGIVALEHGYQQTAYSMVPLLEQISSDDGVIALAMDNTATSDDGPGASASRGWRVQEGAADAIAVTKAFDGRCDTGPTPFVNTLFGESMGGETSGIAAATGATRADGEPLFEYWIDASGVANLTETFLEASTIAPADDYAAEAVADIEAETGGTPLQEPQAYVDDSPVFLALGMKSSGILGAVVVHAVMDGLVTSDEGDQMLAALQAAGIPTDFYTAVFQEPGVTSPTLDGDLLGLVDPGYTSPFAGHVNGIVMDTALSALEALYQKDAAPSGLSVTVSDGELGTIPLLSVPGL